MEPTVTETFKERRVRREREMLEYLLQGEAETAYAALLEASAAFGKAVAARVDALPEDRHPAGHGYAALLFTRATERGFSYVDPRTNEGETS